MKSRIDILFDFIESGKLEEIKKIIDINPRLLNTKNKDGLTPLKLAVYVRKAEIVELLIQKGAKLNNKYADGGKLLHHVSISGNKIIAELLIRNGVDVNFQNKEGFTALHFSAFNGDRDFIEFLISRGADVNIRGKEGITPLVIASVEGYKEVAECLIDNKAELNTLTDKGNSALHLAIYHKKKTMVRYLIERGADTEVRNKEGKTALIFALEEGLVEMAKLLILKGADVNARWPETDVKGYLASATPLHYAVFNNHYELVELLINKGAKVGSRNEVGDTPLHKTDFNENIDIAELLIRNGADVNERGYENWTPLYYAVLHKNEKLAELLIKNGANIYIGDKENFTALHLAVKECQIKILRLLIEKGVDINAKARNYMTPLHIAAVRGLIDIADILLRNGADIEVKNKDGWTPIKLASDHGNKHLVNFFIKKGANPEIINNDNRSIKQKKKWDQAAWRNESGESPREVISRIEDKYLKSLDELKKDIDSQHKKGISKVILSSKEPPEEKLEITKEKISMISSMRPYTADQVENDSIDLALKRYINLQREKNEMLRAMIADNLAEARLIGYSDVEIEKKYGKLILSRNVDIWDDKFDMWMRLEYEKIKKLIERNPSFANIDYVIRKFLVSNDVEFYDVSDFIDFLKNFPSVMWEENFLNVIESIHFEKIWTSGFFIILDYPELFKNRTRVVEILRKWERKLEELIKNEKINKYISDERELFIKLFGFGPEKTLEDIRKTIQKLQN